MGGGKTSYWPASLFPLIPVSSHHLWRRFRDWIDTLAENSDLGIYYGCYLWVLGVSSVVSICWLYIMDPNKYVDLIITYILIYPFKPPVHFFYLTYSHSKDWGHTQIFSVSKLK